MSRGRGLLNIYTSHAIALLGLNKYPELKVKDKYLKMVFNQMHGRTTIEIEDNNKDLVIKKSETKRVKIIKERMKLKEKNTKRDGENR